VTGGTSIYTETKTLEVTDGLFDTVVGPAGIVAGLGAEDLAQPLWIEVTISDGSTITETLAPRQRLYGAPYAFTLMPNAYVSASMDTIIFGANGVDAVLNVVNTHDGDASNPALPALRVVGERGIELSGAAPVDGSGGGHSGAIYSGSGHQDSDLAFYSNDEIAFYLDVDGNSGSRVRIYSGTGDLVCFITETGNLSCNGNSSFGGTKTAVVTMQDGTQRQVYTIESSEVWFEDFGSAALVDGRAVVEIDPLFAQTVNLTEDYHIFLTPLGDCAGLYVAEKTPTGFIVQELQGGASSVAFDYRIVAHRLGYEDLRLERVNLNDFAED